MCSPTAAISGGLSVAQGYAGWQRQQAQYSANKAAINAENQAKRNAYNRSILQRDREWQDTLKVWNQELDQYAKQIKYNNDAAYGFGGAYQASQLEVNRAFTQAAFDNQDALRGLYQSLGSAQATGQGGNTVGRFDTASYAAFGQEQEARVTSLIEAREAKLLKDAQTRRDLEAANNAAYARVAVAPTPGLDPVAPTFRAAPSRPSSLGILTQTASGLFDAGSAGGLFGVKAQNNALKIKQPGANYGASAFGANINPFAGF